MKHRNIASERVRIGMTQVELAEHLGISPASLTRYEMDPMTASPTVIRKAAALFGCTTDYLFDLTEERTRR